MARLNIFILLTKAGPDREAQERAIRAAIKVTAPHDQFYVDDLSKRRSKRDHHFPMRTAAITHSREGDTFVVASPGMIGIGREDVRKVLHQLYEKRVPLFDASTGKTIMWTDEIADGLQFLERAETEYRSLVTARARSGKNGSPKKKLKVTEAQAKIMWHDRARYPSPTKVAALIGLSERACYLNYGKRQPEGAVVPRKPKPIVAAPGRNFVYVMSRADGCHKIGFSQDLTRRQRALQNEFRMPIQLVHYIDRPGDANPAEWYAHYLLREHRRDGEWFAVEAARAVEAIQQASDRLDLEQKCREEDKRRTTAQAKQRAIVQAQEDILGRQMSRAEITAFLATLNKQDETDA